MGLADLHMHTIYSYDGTATVPAVLRRAKQAGLDVIAITDHDEIRGALKALELASKFEIDVIPGVEITTAEGDLLALFVTETVPPQLPLIETLLRVGELGGICIAPHPCATGMAMNSLNGYSIRQAFKHPEASRILVAIETYNATVLDRYSNRYAAALAEWLGLARTGSSDAHVLAAIGAGSTYFPGKTASDLKAALWMGATRPQKAGGEWSSARILSSWLAGYIQSAPMHIGLARAQ